MNSVIVQNDRYTVDSLYQWDVNQDLEIRGLSLPSIPEIHFTNEAMGGAIVRQATMDDAGIITVSVPNSLLQKPYTITAYICIYENETRKSLYSIGIPIKARKRPDDYTIEDSDEEIYSFNALENKVTNALVKITDAETNYNKAVRLVETLNVDLQTATSMAEQSKTNYDSAKTAYDNASKILEDNADILKTLGNKANKPTTTASSLLATGWSGNTYSFESVYPVATYDIEIALDSIATVEQAEAFNNAQIVGSATTNAVTSFGDVPTVDIPIIIKAVTK